MKVLYREGDLLLWQSDDDCFLSVGEKTYQLSDHPYEPCLYIKTADGTVIAIHNAFTVDELCSAAQTEGAIRMITGNEYDLQGISRLLRKALALLISSADIGYLEGCCFMDVLKEYGAVSRETAMDLSPEGMNNPKMMNPLIHAKKVCRTEDGRFYLL